MGFITSVRVTLATAMLGILLVSGLADPASPQTETGDWQLTSIDVNPFDSEQIQPSSSATLGNGFYDHQFLGATLEVTWDRPPATLTPGQSRSIAIHARFRPAGGPRAGFHHADIRFAPNLVAVQPTLNVLQGCSDIGASLTCQDPVDETIDVRYTVPTEGERYSIYIRDRFCDMCAVRYLYERGVAALPTCNGLPATIGPEDRSLGNLIGTDGDDVIVGTSEVDFINGRGGNDTICGRGGNDIIKGGAGRDTIFGGSGADIIRGQANADTLNGGKGQDDIFGAGGDDTISGGARKDEIEGGKGSDTIDGGSGPDEISGDGGRDSIDGGRGKDRLSGGPGPDTLRGGAHRDRLWGHLEDTTRRNDDNRRDRLYGDGGNDYLASHGGPDLLDGGDGTDLLVAGRGNDTLDGGDGDDDYRAGPGTDDCVADPDDGPYRDCEF